MQFIIYFLEYSSLLISFYLCFTLLSFFLLILWVLFLFISVDSNQSQIMFTKTNDYAFTIKEDCIDSITITTTDDLGESIDWNNQLLLKLHF